MLGELMDVMEDTTEEVSTICTFMAARDWTPRAMLYALAPHRRSIAPLSLLRVCGRGHDVMGQRAFTNQRAVRAAVIFISQSQHGACPGVRSL